MQILEKKKYNGAVGVDFLLMNKYAKHAFYE